MAVQKSGEIRDKAPLRQCLVYFSRNPQTYVPKPTYPVGSVAQQPRISATNCTHHQAPQHLPSSAAALHLPLASLLRAGVAVPSGAQTSQSVSLTHNSTSSTSTSTANQQASASKDEVVMIDLDELPSPTKPMQEPYSLQTHQTRLNNDLVRMARNAFPNISPGFIELLINQGGAQSSQDPIAHGFQAPNAHGSQESSVHPQASTQVVDIEGASVDNTSSNRTSTAKNSQELRALLANSPSGQETAQAQSTPNPTIVQDVIMVLNETGNSAPQETADVSSSPTPPTVQDVSNASDQPNNPAQQETATVRSSPNPPTGNKQRNSPSPQGEAGKDSTSSKEQTSSLNEGSD